MCASILCSKEWPGWLPIVQFACYAWLLSLCHCVFSCLSHVPGAARAACLPVCPPAAEHSVKLHCYTFGAPRTGNHTFARMYEEAVPETWHIINNDDLVTQAGKFVNLYKRGGPRVLVNRLGALVVRPSYAETVIRRVPGGKWVCCG